MCLDTSELIDRRWFPRQQNLSIPWLSIAKSKVVYAIIVAKFAFGFNHAVVIDNGPSYLNNVAGFGMERTSVHIAIVYTITALTVLFLGHLYPRIKKYFPLRQLHLRKIFQAIGWWFALFSFPMCDQF